MMDVHPLHYILGILIYLLEFGLIVYYLESEGQKRFARLAIVGILAFGLKLVLWSFITSSLLERRMKGWAAILLGVLLSFVAWIVVLPIVHDVLQLIYGGHLMPADEFFSGLFFLLILVVHRIFRPDTYLTRGSVNAEAIE